MSIHIIIDTAPLQFSVSPQWTIGTLALQAGSSVDISQSLPAGIPAGGTFGVSGSVSLPAGVTLSPAGVISVAAGAPAGSVSGVVFSYDYTA